MEASRRVRPAPAGSTSRQVQDGWDERHLRRLGSAQDGVVRIDQLTALGLSEDQRRTRLRQGRLAAEHRGVYSVGHGDLSERGRQRAAVWACGSPSWLGFLPAARLLGIWERPCPVPHVVVLRPRLPRPRGVEVHQTIELAERDVTHVRGLPCTSVSRTIVDLATVESPAVVEGVFERAERRRLVRADVIEELLTRRPRTPGIGVVRSLLATHRPRSGPTRSILERRLLAGLRRTGIPEPVVNGRLVVGDRTLEPDLMWPARSLLVELDGGETHATRRAMRRDRARDRATLAAGWTTLRFTWDDVDLELPMVLADVGAALAGT